MLKKQLAFQGFQKNGFELVHREIIKTLANAIPDEALVREARNIPMLAKEMVILNVGKERPDVKKYIKKYIKSFTSFMTVNGYPVSISENEEEETITFFAKQISVENTLFSGRR